MECAKNDYVIKRVIRSSDVDTSDEAVQAFIEDMEIGGDVIRAMHEDNDLRLDDERRNLDIPTRNPIVVIAELGLWNGRRVGYSVLDKQNVSAILCTSRGDFTTFFADAYNLTAPTPYGVGFQEGLSAPRSVGYAAILKPQGHLTAA